LYINEAERTVLGKICYYGPANVGKEELLAALYTHYAALAGEHADWGVKQFEPREQLPADDVGAFVEAAERLFGGPYDELTESGTLVWMRARVQSSQAPTHYHRTVDVYSATGAAFYGWLRKYSLSQADCVVFVADGRPERREATVESWENLRDSGFDGPIVLLVNHDTDPDYIGEMLGHTGPGFSEDKGFSGSHDAFQAAAALTFGAAATVN
jgi:hypothetical protein